jgi:hypothetical protein
MIGIEMLQQFKANHYIFIPTILPKFDSANAFGFVIFVIFFFCSLINLLKLIYEMNIYFQVFVHISCLLSEAINLCFVIMLLL